ncbi:hypothetical protein C6502_07685 [Candidatus Poribacteria bacterium]|nr:MAG: hypothetical protein C6502_07685 [Candidatus Poribacteria bacterium]
MHRRFHRFSFKLTYYIFVIVLLLVEASRAFAQLQREYGQELFEQETEASAAFESDLTIDYEVSNVFNNHVEFGLSIDPNTSSLARREDPQLIGVINRAGVNLQGTLPLGKRFGLTLQYYPQLENYIGENGKLNEFDAFTDLFLTELSFRPTAQLPIVSVSHQLRRLDRRDDAFDNLQRQIGFRFGKLLEYNLYINRFDDEMTRRADFLLVGSTMHQGRARIQLGILKSVLAKLEYSLEQESYKGNLNDLLLGIAGIEKEDSRTDLRNLVSAKLIQIPAGRLLLQQELNLLLSNSNVGFYDFSTIEAAVGAFYKINAESWVRLRLSRLGITFDGRRVRGDDGFVGENAEKRKDNQFGVTFQINWQLRNSLTLVADYQLTLNDTNENFEFLNYTHNVASLTLQASY